MPVPYLLPQVLVFQEFTDIAPEITNPLRAWIVGPNAELHRHAIEDEKQSGLLGAYNYLAETAYSWPNKTAGSEVDQAYTKIFVDDAKLRYFQDLIGLNSTIAAVSGRPNRVRSNSAAFKAATGFPRTATLYDRDVQIGDLVWLRGSFDGAQEELWTYVRGLVAEVIGTSVSATDADADNATTVTNSVAVTQIGGLTNLLNLSVSIADYNAYIDGDLTDTYVLTVTRGSVDGDLTTARFRLETASGYEYLTDLTPAAENSVDTYGSRGIELGWIASGDPGDVDPGADEDDLIIGQKFQVVITQAFTVPDAVSAGTYVGVVDNTYVVTVASGGLFDDPIASRLPRLNIHTTLGIDGQQNVSVSGLTVAIPLGTSGATLTFGGTSLGLRKGDKFYVEVNAATTGRVSTLVLGHSLSATLQAATDLDLELYIKKDVEIPEYRTDSTPVANWETSETQITLAADIVAFDSSWTSGGVALPIPVLAGTAYVEYREWLVALAADVGSVSDISEIDTIPGPLDPDNPLKWAVSKAVANSNSTGVRFTAVGAPTNLESWTDALGLGTERDDLYSLVPLTTDKTILDLFVAHVNSMSGESKGRWRKVFVPLVAEDNSAVVSHNKSSDGDAVLATITDDPTSSGTQYTLVTVASENALLVELNVRAGDTLRTNFSENELGEAVYDEFVIDDLVNESSVRLLTGPNTAVSVAQKIEIWHKNSKTELVKQIGSLAGSYGNRRVCAVWPDVVASGGRTFPGYHMCAALAGLASGVAPHQHLTNVQISGFDTVARTNGLFSAAQLDDLAAYGVWIVTKTVEGSIISRDALTTNMTTLQSKTDMVVRNVDSISYLILGRFRQYIGRANVTPSTLRQLRLEFISAIEYLKNNGFTPRLGSQLIDGSIIELRQHILQKDRVVAAIRLEIPFPLNVLEIHLVA